MTRPRFAPSPVLIAAFCIFCGSGIDAIVKGVAMQTALTTILAWRFLFGGILAFGLYMRASAPRPSFRAIRFHTMRGGVQLSAALLFFWAVTQLALAEATVIGFTAALMVAPLASLILKERISPLSMVAALVGFAGAVLAISSGTSGAPENANRLLGAIAGFVAAFLYALTLVLIRLRSREETPLTIAMFTNIVPAIMLLPFLVLSGPTLDVKLLPIFALLGVLGFSVWYLFTIAYSRAPAQRLAPLEYTALIWSAALGAFFFDEVPGWQLYVGAIIIIAACLIVAFEGRFETRKTLRAPTSDLPD